MSNYVTLGQGHNDVTLGIKHTQVYIYILLECSMPNIFAFGYWFVNIRFFLNFPFLVPFWAEQFVTLDISFQQT